MGWKVRTPFAETLIEPEQRLIVGGALGSATVTPGLRAVHFLENAFEDRHHLSPRFEATQNVNLDSFKIGQLGFVDKLARGLVEPEIVLVGFLDRGPVRLDLSAAKLGRLIERGREHLVHNVAGPEDPQSLFMLCHRRVRCIRAVAGFVGYVIVTAAVVLMMRRGSRDGGATMQVHVKSHPAGDTAELEGAGRVAAAELDHSEEDSSLDGGDILGELAFEDARLDPLDKVIAQLVGFVGRLGALRRASVDLLHDRIGALLTVSASGVGVSVEGVGSDSEHGFKQDGS